MHLFKHISHYARNHLVQKCYKVKTMCSASLCDYYVLLFTITAPLRYKARWNYV